MESKIQAMHVTEASVESSSSAVEWGAIAAGALGAVGVSIVLMTFGPGISLATISAWYLSKQSVAPFGVAAGIWLIITQCVSSGIGGYLAGRLRKKWVGIRTPEVVFRDFAHGFLSWALATIVVAVLFTIAAMTVPASSIAQQAATAFPNVADHARRAVAFSLYSSLPLVIAAFIASIAGLEGGRHRDK